MIGYVAKNRDGEVYLFTEKPTLEDCTECWFSSSSDVIRVTGQFPKFDNMSYTDEPIKVEIKLERV